MARRSLCLLSPFLELLLAAKTNLCVPLIPQPRPQFGYALYPPSLLPLEAAEDGVFSLPQDEQTVVLACLLSPVYWDSNKDVCLNRALPNNAV